MRGVPRAVTLLFVSSLVVLARPAPSRAFRELRDDPEFHDSATPVVRSSTTVALGIGSRTPSGMLITQFHDVVRRSAATWTEPVCSSLELGTLSTELYDVPIPEALRARFVNEHGRVGALIGLDAPPVAKTVTAPGGPIRLANIKLLTLTELQHIVSHGEAGREEVTRRLQATATPLVSSLAREPVI